MQTVIRFVKNNISWDNDFKKLSWLRLGEIPADPLEDLCTKANRLSIYNAGENSENLERIVAAYTANRLVEFKKQDYIIFSPDVLPDLNIVVKDNVRGDLDDELVNGWHIELCELSADTILKLAKKILPVCQPGRMDREMVACLIDNSIKRGWIPIDKLKKPLRDNLPKYSKEQ